MSFCVKSLPQCLVHRIIRAKRVVATQMDQATVLTPSLLAPELVGIEDDALNTTNVSEAC